MPVILDPTNYGRSFAEDVSDQVQLMMMLKPVPAQAMKAYPVSVRAGNVKHDDAALMEPMTA
jgi:putative SOS response-associated peptidase YedK